MVSVDSHGHFSLGERLLGFGGSTGAHIAALFRPTIERVARATDGETVDLSILRGQRMLFINGGKVESLADARAKLARAAGLEVHAGHGLDYATAETIAALGEIVELNIGYYMIGEAIFVGIGETVRQMRAAMARGRQKAEIAA